MHGALIEATAVMALAECPADLADSERVLSSVDGHHLVGKTKPQTSNLTGHVLHNQGRQAEVPRQIVPSTQVWLMISLILTC